jgi:hypothetical protein
MTNKKIRNKPYLIMKHYYKYLSIVLITVLVIPLTLSLHAGNKDRSGQAGASELLINPWARSNGWGGANMAKVSGLEAMWANVAGAAKISGTQVILSYTDYLKGSGTNIAAFGLTTKIGEAGAIGIQVVSMSFGEIEITTTDSPEGGLGVYKPNLMNVSVSFSKAFSNSIYGGVLIKGVSESIADANAFGIAIDAGIQYVTGAREQIAFGISLKNVGPKMKFSGDGLSIKAFIPGQDNAFTLEQRSQPFNLPTQLQIGAAYDFLMPKDYRITLGGNFVSNSFTRDQFSLGLEFSLKDYFMVRGGYTYENGMFEETTADNNTNINNGLSVGVSVAVPLNKEKGSFIGIDYAFRETAAFNNNHTLGIIFNF